MGEVKEPVLTGRKAYNVMACSRFWQIKQGRLKVEKDHKESTNFEPVLTGLKAYNVMACSRFWQIK